MKLDPMRLLLWCLEHIKCDLCQTEGATYQPRYKVFLCAADTKLAGEIYPAASE